MRKSIIKTAGTVLFALLVFGANGQATSPVPIPPQQIRIGCNKTMMLLFPYDIKHADYGSDGIIVQPPGKTSNVLRIKGARENFEPTNVSVLTTNGALYSIDVIYDRDPPVNAFAFSNVQNRNRPFSVLFKEGLNPATIRDYAQFIAQGRPVTRRPVINRYQMHMHLRNVFYKDNLLFFAFEIRNRSHIPFHVYFTRFYLRDKKQKKRSSVMEKEIEPREVYFTTDSTIAIGEPSLMVVVFDGFTIADRKYFSVELYEQNGDRQLSLPVQGRHILNARPFVSLAPAN